MNEERRRHVEALAGPDGVVIGLALDHRDNFLAVLARAGREEPGIPALKERLVRALAPQATALMLDHEMGSAAIEHGAIPDDIGLIMPLEEQGYEQMGDDRLTTLMPSFSPERAAELGASACKLLLPYRPDRRDTAQAQLDTASDAIGRSQAAGLPLVLEPTIYRLASEDEAAYLDSHADMVIVSTAETAALRPDVLKLPHPMPASATTDARVSAEACARLDTATSGIPWVLLGAGVSVDVFAEQIGSAGKAGASGFLAGRSIWSDAVVAPESERPAAIEEAGVRLAEFSTIARAASRSIRARLADSRA